MKFFQPQASFASGELTPMLAARTDLAAYNIGARELTNFIVLPQGGLVNRPGTRVLAEGALLEGARLIPFVFNASTAYCLVYKSGGEIDVYGADGVFVHTFTGYAYTADQLNALRTLQSADIMYLFHPDCQTQKVRRFGETTWDVVPVEFKNGPYQDMNTDQTREMTVETDTGTGITYLRCSTPYFIPAHVGLLFKIEYKVAATGTTYRLSYNYNGVVPPDVPPAPQTVSAEFMLFGAFTIKSEGLWTGIVEIERKYPTDTGFVAVKHYESSNDYNFGFADSEDTYGTLYRIKYWRNSGSGSVSLEWASGGGLVARQVKTTAYVDDQTMIVEATDDIENDAGPSLDWAFGAFGALFGWPSLGIFHQERLVLANTPTARQTIWMSQSASWENFGTSIPTEDTDGITATLAAKQVNEIVGLASRSDLLIFTGGAEWVAKAGSRSDVFTPSDIVMTPSGYHGAHDIEPLDVGTSTLFVQRHGKVVRGMGYQLDVDGYASNELSILSAHLFEHTRVRRWAYQQEPWSVVWMVLETGDVLALTMQQEHQVTAWTRQRFHAPVLDAISVPGDTEDELFLLCGDQLLMLCARRDESPVMPEDYLDAGAYPYVSAFESMELEQNLNGSLQGRHKHVPKIMVRVFRTSGFHAGIMTENSREMDQIKFPGDLSPSDRAEPFTGDIHVEVPGGYARGTRVRVENRKPQPVTVLGVFQEVEIGEG